MKDIQGGPDDRRINIRKVGVRNLSYPVIVLDKARRAQQTVAVVNMYVNLPHQFKGTHMSRFVEILHGFHERFTLAAYRRILEETRARLNAGSAHLEMAFPYFVDGAARYDCRLVGSLGEDLDLLVEVAVPVRSGAQPWGLATVAVRMLRLLWIEDLIDMVEAAPLPERPTAAGACRAIAGVLEASPALTWHRTRVAERGPAGGPASFAEREWPESRDKALAASPVFGLLPTTCEENRHDAGTVV